MMSRAALPLMALLVAVVAGHVLPSGRYEPPAVRKARELEVVRRIAELAPEERLAVWERETGKSRAGLYRRMKEIA